MFNPGRARSITAASSSSGVTPSSSRTTCALIAEEKLRKLITARSRLAPRVEKTTAAQHKLRVRWVEGRPEYQDSPPTTGPARSSKSEGDFA